MQLKLRIVGGKHAGQEVAVQSDKFLIGRGEKCHLRPTSESISRHHCEISIEGQTARITDLNSSNGTFVNGARIQGERKLQAGDQLRVGPLAFEIVITPSAAHIESAATHEHIFAPGESQPTESSPSGRIMGWLADGVGAAPQVGTVEFKLDETHGELPRPVAPSAGLTSHGVGQTTAGGARTMRLPSLPEPEKVESKDAGDAASAVIGNLRSTIRDKQSRMTRRKPNKP